MYPQPNINDILDSLRSAKYFSVFDLATAFHHIKMDSRDSHKKTPHGHYEFDRMPFGLKKAPATFQRIMNSTLTVLIGLELFVYLDDIVTYANTLEEHEIKFNNLAERLIKANLHLQRPDPKKIIVVKNFSVPKTQKKC